MQEINSKIENELKSLNENRKYNYIYLEIMNLSKQELEQLSDEQIMDKMLNLIQKKIN